MIDYKELKEIGIILAKKVEENGLTIASLKSNTGMAVNTLKSVLDGTCPKITTILDIAKLFNLTLYDLCDLARGKPIATPAPQAPQAEAPKPGLNLKTGAKAEVKLEAYRAPLAQPADTTSPPEPVV